MKFSLILIFLAVFIMPGCITAVDVANIGVGLLTNPVATVVGVSTGIVAGTVAGAIVADSPSPDQGELHSGKKADQTEINNPNQIKGKKNVE
ncbi:hypothetical protein [Desulfonema limicola]|uniref:hypothetical protein n=1 Tax=Desulfonema limicola TaxID=45656 RepID=UPI001A9BB6A6|nr:hypothetical protein [Desulfonema limicola]